MIKTKNQHYIPQCILKNFVSNNTNIYEGLIPKLKVYETNIRNSMSKRYMYEDESIEDNYIENEFAQLEGELSTKTNKLISDIYETKFDNRQIYDIYNQLESYIPLVIVMYYRSGALFEEFEFSNLDFDGKLGGNTNIKSPVFAMLEKIQNSEYILGLTKTILDDYKFAILISEDDFTISDQYLSTAALKIKSRFINYSNRMIGLKDTLILIPLSKKIYFCFFHNTNTFEIVENQYNFLSDIQLNNFNNCIANNSYLKFAGANEDTMKLYIKNIIVKSPIGTLATFNNGTKVKSTVKKEVFFYEKDAKNWEFFITHMWHKMEGVKRNELCPCGSNKKFKKCCIELYQESKRIIMDLQYRDNKDYEISNTSVKEMQISELANI